MTSLFDSARLKLTFWYVLTIFLITGTLSGLFYFRTTRVLDREFDRISVRLQNEATLQPPRDFPRPFRLRILPEDVAAAKRQIVYQIVFINGFIMFIVAGAGYVLSGLTLKPIKEAMEEQNRFIADASHELKTPITALKTSLEVNLMDGKITSETKKILKENLEDVKGLEVLSESLLKLAGSNEQKIDNEIHSLEKITQQAIKILDPLAKKKNISVSLVTKSKPKVEGDYSKLVDLLLIFVENAIKYSSKDGQVKLVLQATKKSAVVKIIDKGSGIDEQDLPHIFDRFYRSDKARNKSATNGYGLGLSVAQKILNQHNGSVSVESQINQGSTFTIKLPLVG